MKVEKLLLDILSVQSASRKEERMIYFLKAYCLKKGYIVKVLEDNIYVTKGFGEHYPCYVAHTDTCADIIPDDEFTIVSLDDSELAGYNYKKDKFTQVGFDDKIGIFIALKMLDMIPYGKAFFPHAEEIGCVGTRKADMSFFDDCAYLIQCDRRNAKGIVDNVSGVGLFGEDFKDVLLLEGAKYERRMTTGMLTDVYTLKTMGLKVSCTNLECGYYNPHSNDDYCILDEVYSTLDFVEDVYNSTKGQKFEHVYIAPVYKSNYSKNYYGGYYGSSWDDYYDFDNYYGKNNASSKKDNLDKQYGMFEDYCDCCGSWDSIEHNKKSDMYLCKDCSVAFTGTTHGVS
jgi:hypothetical protein